LRDTGLEDNLVWMPHCLTFSKPGGVLSPLRFPAALPAPFNGLAAIARAPLAGNYEFRITNSSFAPVIRNSEFVIRNWDKLRTGLGLLWPVLASQAYIDSQDAISYETWHLRHGLSRRSLAGFFDTMALALNFGTSREVSAKLVLTVLSHFGKDTDASRVAFLKGSPETRLFRPLLAHLQARGVEVRFNSKVRQVLYDPGNGLVTGLALAGGSIVTGDVYISAMPAHNLWKALPLSMREMPPFTGLRHLHGVPVMTVQLYFDRPVTGVSNLMFSSGTHISVYAELGQICHAASRSPESRVQSPESVPGDSGLWTLDSGLPRSGLVELVVAPAAEWFHLDDAELTSRVMREFTALHPRAAGARLLKSTVVRIPQSVYKARPGMDRHRPGQATGIPNFFLCGDYTRQNYLASMEGAVLSGKRVAARVREAELPAVGASRYEPATLPAPEVALGA